MAKTEKICAVPGCDNELSEEQQGKNIVICSGCEAAKMHICEACNKKLSENRIRDGATLCMECEMNPSEMGVEEGIEEGMEDDMEPSLSPEYESESSEEDFMV